MGFFRFGVCSRLRFFCFGWLAGGGPAASNFLLLRQKKVTKEKATRLPGSLRFATGNLRCPEKAGVRANSPAAQTSTALIPLFPVITGPGRTGHSGNKNPNSPTAQQPNSHSAQVLAMNATNSIAACACSACARGTFCSQIWLFSLVSAPDPAPASPVLAEPVMRGKSGIRAARCLSRRRVCADPRFCPSSQVARSEAKGLRQPGRLSFAYFSLAKQRKVSCRRATPGLPTLQTSAAIPGTTSC